MPLPVHCGQLTYYTACYDGQDEVPFEHSVNTFVGIFWFPSENKVQLRVKGNTDRVEEGKECWECIHPASNEGACEPSRKVEVSD